MSPISAPEAAEVAFRVQEELPAAGQVFFLSAAGGGSGSGSSSLVATAVMPSQDIGSDRDSGRPVAPPVEMRALGLRCFPCVSRATCSPVSSQDAETISRHTGKKKIVLIQTEQQDN